MNPRFIGTHTKGDKPPDMYLAYVSIMLAIYGSKFRVLGFRRLAAVDIM